MSQFQNLWEQIYIKEPRTQRLSEHEEYDLYMKFMKRKNLLSEKFEGKKQFQQPVQKVSWFKMGDKVKVQGLIKAAQFNGKMGTVVTELMKESGRLEVELDDGDLLRIKPANIQKVPK